MKTSKALILLLLVFLILSTIVISKNHIIGLAANYLPLPIKGAIKVFIKSNGYEKVSNDYNSKFLPFTQFTKLKFKKIKINNLSNAEAGYFQKLKKNSIVYKSFYIDIFNESKIIVTDALGNSYFINNLKDGNIKQNDLKLIRNNIKPLKVLDTFVYKRRYAYKSVHTSHHDFFDTYRMESNYNTL